MAIGKGPGARVVQTGNFGRLSPPPEGGLYVRDPAAANAAAIRRRAEAYEAAGEPVPEHLQNLLKDLPDEAPEIRLVDQVTGEPHGGKLKVEGGSFQENWPATDTAPPPAPTDEHGVHDPSPKFSMHEPQSVGVEAANVQHPTPEAETVQVTHEPVPVPDVEPNPVMAEVPENLVPQSAGESGNSPEGTAKLEAEAAVELQPPAEEPAPPAEKSTEKPKPAEKPRSRGASSRRR